MDFGSLGSFEPICNVVLGPAFLLFFSPWKRGGLVEEAAEEVCMNV
jgi:hypothetical protein